MRRLWPVLPILVAATACSPMRNVEAAARSLQCTVDRVEPSLQLAFPLERSRLAFQITFTVDNPSDVAFHLRGFEGYLRLETPGATFPLGYVTLAQPVDLAAKNHATLNMTVSFAYQDLRDHWSEVQAALRPGAWGTWALEGRLTVDAYGITWPLPVKTMRAFGNHP